MPIRPVFLATILRAVLSAWIAMLAFPASAEPDRFPTRPVKLVVSYGAGGSLDAIARLLAGELSRQFGQPVVVENVPGAGGTLGFRRVASSAPDGHTLLVASTSEVALAPTANPQARYRATDLEAIAEIGTSGIVLIGRPDLPAGSLRELLAMARARPGALRYATSGGATLQHLAMESAKRAAGVDIPFVPYKSAAQIVTDLAGGHIDLAIIGLPAVLPLIREGKVKAYGVTSRKRDAGDRSIPAFAETPGLEGIDFHLWSGVFAPKGTPADVVQKIHAAIAAVLRQADVAHRFAQMGVELAEPASAAQFARAVASQERALREAFHRSGIQIEP